MRKKVKLIGSLVLSLLLVVSITITFLTAKKDKHKDYDLMIQASNKTNECFNYVKQYKINNNIEFSSFDIYGSGLLGSDDFTSITSGSGSVDVKRSITNPNFSALFIKYFNELGLVKNDSIVVQLTGSFISLDISFLVACEVYELNSLVFMGLSSSYYGSTNLELTDVDIIHKLNENNLLNVDIDYFSMGGHNDSGNYDYGIFDEELDKIKNRSISYGYRFLEGEDLYSNIVKKRINIINNECPSFKAFFNIGGHTASVGQGPKDISYSTINGILRSSRYHSFTYEEENSGLIEYYLSKGIDCVNMLHIKELCIQEGIDFDASTYPIGKGDMYYDISYNLTFPIISLSITIISLTLYYLDKKKIIKLIKE